MSRIVVSPAETDTVVAAVATVDPALFSQYQGTWRDSISMALLDAVYSIRATYHASEGKGVWNRLQTFHEAHGDAAERLCGLGVETADGLRARLPDAGRWTESEEFLGAHNVALHPLKKACTGVHGLGAVTFEYFLILVGVPGVKADAMIRRFVAHAVGRRDEDAATPGQARDLVIAAYQAPAGTKHYPEDLTASEHALWQHQRVI